MRKIQFKSISKEFEDNPFRFTKRLIIDVGLLILIPESILLFSIKTMK